MSIWIFIWLLVSAALIYFSAWTSIIILRQRKAWQSFASTNKLRFQGDGLFTAPKISGFYKGYEVSLFPSEHQTTDSRGVRKLTAAEVLIKDPMPCEGVIGTGGMVSLIQSLDFKEEIRPSVKWWDPSAIIKTDNTPALEAYLTPERLKALMGLARVKNVWMIFIFKGKDTILRLDTPDPLESKTKIEKILHIMLETAKVLELAPGEASRLKLAEKVKAPTLSVPDTPEEIGLELEEDDT